MLCQEFCWLFEYSCYVPSSIFLKVRIHFLSWCSVHSSIVQRDDLVFVLHHIELKHSFSEERYLMHMCCKYLYFIDLFNWVCPDIFIGCVQEVTFLDLWRAHLTADCFIGLTIVGFITIWWEIQVLLRGYLFYEFWFIVPFASTFAIWLVLFRYYPILT